MTHHRRLFLTAAASLVLVAGCGPAVPTPHEPRTGPAEVVLFGDSLAYQAAPYFDWLVQASGRSTVKNFVFSGTATCDWLPDMRRVAKTDPLVVVMEFAGNTFTKCMNGCSPETVSAVTRYCDDMTTAIHLFLAVGTKVFLDGTPITLTQWQTHDRHWDDLNRAFAALAARYPGSVTYFDAGRAVEGPGGAFVWTLPCLYFEPCDGPTIGGVRNDVVRSPDGVHFCPDSGGNGPGIVSPCDVYSSGAYRFASAMATPVLQAVDSAGHDP